MMPMSIRMRLTLSYCLLLTITLGLLGASLFLVMRRGVYAATDSDLHTRLEGVRRLMERQKPGISGDDLRDEFREHLGLRPGGDLLEVWDEHGEIVFQSASIRDYEVPMPTPKVRIEVENMAVRDGPLRALNATMRIQDRGSAERTSRGWYSDYFSEHSPLFASTNRNDDNRSIEPD